MKTKKLRNLLIGEVQDILAVFLQLTLLQDVVLLPACGAATIVELVLRIADYTLVVEIFEDGLDGATVPIVGDSSTVVALPGEIPEGTEGHIIEGVYHHVQLAHGDAEV